MSWHITVSSVDAVGSRMDSIHNNLHSRLEEAMAISVRDVQERARANHRFTTRTGEAERSIEAKSRALVILSLAKSAQRAYHNLSAPRHQAHDIEPRSKKVLRWASGGKFVFAKRAHNPGIKKDPFIFNAEEAEAGAIKQRFDDIIEGLEG